MTLAKLSRRTELAYLGGWVLILATSLTPHPLKAEECAGGGEVRRALQLHNGNMINAEAVIHVHQCDNVVLQWRSNRPETIQLPEYGIELPIVPDMPGEMAFKATKIGRYRLALKNADGSFTPLFLAIEVRAGH